MGFLGFFLVLWVNTQFIAPAISNPVGGLLSPLGAFAIFASSLVLAFIGYWLYAFVVRKTGAEPEA